MESPLLKIFFAIKVVHSFVEIVCILESNSIRYWHRFQNEHDDSTAMITPIHLLPTNYQHECAVENNKFAGVVWNTVDPFHGFMP